MHWNIFHNWQSLKWIPSFTTIPEIEYVPDRYVSHRLASPISLWMLKGKTLLPFRERTARLRRKCSLCKLWYSLHNKPTIGPTRKDRGSKPLSKNQLNGAWAEPLLWKNFRKIQICLDINNLNKIIIGERQIFQRVKGMLPKLIHFMRHQASGSHHRIKTQCCWPHSSHKRGLLSLQKVAFWCIVSTWTFPKEHFSAYWWHW